MALEDEDTVVEVRSEPEEEEVLPAKSDHPNMEVRPVRSTTSQVQSASNSEKLRELRELQVKNMKNDLGVYNSFSLPPRSYPSPNVFYVEGTPSKFWLSINNPAVSELNSLIKVFNVPCFLALLIYSLYSLEVAHETE